MSHVAKLLIPPDVLSVLHVPDTRLKAQEILYFILGVFSYFCCFVLAGISAKPHYLPIAIRLLVLLFATDLYNSYVLNRFLFAHTAFTKKLYHHYHHAYPDDISLHLSPENHLLAKILLGIPGCLFLAFILYII